MRSLKELMDLTGRTALITGGAGHIGSALAEALAELGARVALLDQSAEVCEPVAERIANTYGVKALPLPVDLANEETLRQAPKQVADALGGLDILIHSAGWVGTTQKPGWVTSLDKQSVEAWDAAMRVNLTSAFVLAQESRPLLEASKHGSIIFVLSTYGLVGPDFRLYEGTPMTTPAGYAASKGGLLQLGRYLATAFAPTIRVNSITPGGVWRNQLEVFHERYVSRTPLQRMGIEEDFKGAGAYLASDLSAYVTGQNLIVDGGWTAW